ncbi:MAG: carboxypeptidase regulatory-like domain-containing protein [Gammaproteobacteria bacterium]|nr:carboxypeptidase regulatory-like domain-containing protein [Gammaproteobacteria bacterium]MDH3464942.1 carboxypeptidase regulatory-like domain-containing protein [Gammaproteobacteria bacterium]
MQLQIEPRKDLPLRIREHPARPMNLIVLTAVGVCLAVVVALAWIYYSGEENSTGLRVADETRTVESGAADQTPQPAGGMPEFSSLERDESSGAVSPDPTSAASNNNPFSSSPSQAFVSDDEVQAFVQEKQPVAQTVVRTPKQRDAPKKVAAPLGDLAISGRVMTRAGRPVSGIALTATAGQVVDQDKGKLVLARGNHHETTSGYDGAYKFQQLADGEYHLRTTATRQYAEARMSVRAGVDFADLVLTAHWDLRVHGVVSTPAGEPLRGTQVQPLIHAVKAVSTDKDGEYAFAVKVMETAQNLVINASKDGYKDKKVSLKVAKANAGNDVALNIVMEPEPTALAVVSGSVHSSLGEPVAGQRIQMSSTRARENYSATSDKDGKFVIEGVEVSDDYMLSINAADAYEDYFERNLQVTDDGLTLSIELKAKDVGTLTGQMVDLYGNAISHFSLVLQRKKTSYYNARVVGDAVGAFLVENAPAGELRFKTKSNPYHRIEGIRLAAGDEHDVMIVLDSGYDEIRGRVEDGRLNPVAVPNITLTWAHQQKGIRSTSRRTTAADEQGNFAFTQIGPGPHTIRINAPGYKPVQFNHDVTESGSDVVVRLEDQ